MAKMEPVDAIFAIARMENKIYVVARSRTSEVDASEIVAPLGGGGHTFAAATTVKGMTLTQVEHKLIEILYKKIRSNRLARDLMSSPPISIRSDISCRDAGNLLTRYNINALLVTENPKEPDGRERLSGYISRQVIEKALYHKLELVQVKEYMTTDFAFVNSGAVLTEIQEKIIENKQRLLPVMDNGVITGVITRTDLLNVLVKDSRHKSEISPDPLTERVRARTRNIVKFMKERLSKRLVDILKTLGKIADKKGYRAYVVGGFVRDLFLYRVNEDIDIVIEGDGIAFAKKYASIVGARIHSYKKFGTAVIIFPDGFKIDVASARMEYYKFPAALPTVEMSSIKLDLFRRDFTVNTLAIQLSPDRFGILIDFFTAQKDIKEKTIRILHNLSFVEDPTRVFRAIRFEQRFGFSIGKLTSGLIENAVKMDFFKRLSGRRVFAEFRQILEEENPTPAIIRLNDYNLLSVLHLSITLDNDLISLFNSVKKVLSWHDLLFLEESYMKWAVYFLALIRSGDKKMTNEICVHFELAPRYRRLFCVERFEADRCLFWLERHLPVKNSVLYNKLSGFKTELLLYMMAATKKEIVKRSISNYFTRLRYVHTLISGKDLKNMEIEPGPVFREILQTVLEAKLNGKLKTKSDELAFVRRYI
jgi:tRNA nucleotidyltransferase (CCA-adding enzyme)